MLAQRKVRWPWLGMIAIAAGLGLVAPASTSAAPGDLDPTFGTDGQLIVSFGPSEERPSAAVLQRHVQGGGEVASRRSVPLRGLSRDPSRSATSR